MISEQLKAEANHNKQDFAVETHLSYAQENNSAWMTYLAQIERVKPYLGDLTKYIVKLLYYSYKIRKKLEITHRLSRSTILYAYV